MKPWELWKKAFYAWEDTTARALEQVMRSPSMLSPAGRVLKAVTQMKVASDEAAALWWSSLGLPTRRDQERSLHRINELESRLVDLEERLVTMRAHPVGEGPSAGSAAGAAGDAARGAPGQPRRSRRRAAKSEAKGD